MHLPPVNTTSHSDKTAFDSTYKLTNTPLCHKYIKTYRQGQTTPTPIAQQPPPTEPPTTVRSSTPGTGALRWDTAPSERPSFRRMDFPGSLIRCDASCWEHPRRDCPLASATRSPTCALWRGRGGGRGGQWVHCHRRGGGAVSRLMGGSSCYRLGTYTTAATWQAACPLHAKFVHPPCMYTAL